MGLGWGSGSEAGGVPGAGTRGRVLPPATPSSSTMQSDWLCRTSGTPRTSWMRCCRSLRWVRPERRGQRKWRLFRGRGTVGAVALPHPCRQTRACACPSKHHTCRWAAAGSGLTCSLVCRTLTWSRRQKMSQTESGMVPRGTQTRPESGRRPLQGRPVAMTGFQNAPRQPPALTCVSARPSPALPPVCLSIPLTSPLSGPRYLSPSPYSGSNGSAPASTLDTHSRH